MTTIWDKIKAAALWVWNWITVLTVTMLGFLSIAIDYLDQLAGIDMTQVMTQRRAAQITFGVAVVKGVVTAYNSRRAKT
jgi:hypothetical protein